MRFNETLKKCLKFLKKCIKKIQKLLFLLLVKLYKLPKKTTAIIVMDGGLCSQMFEYSLGELLKIHGYKVKYDLSWFNINGKDVFGINARKFEIKKLFPSLRIKKASKITIHKFKNSCRYDIEDFNNLLLQKKNIYFLNDVPRKYPREDLYKITKQIFSNPIELKDKKNAKLIYEIKNNMHSCAVHIRRGDLANPEVAKVSGYGNCVSDDYYIKAIEIMKKIIPESKFYFFSDDIEYVKNVLIPKLKNINYRIVDENKDSILNGGGYKDFYLISVCKNQICSLGSFGVEASKINKNDNKIVISPRDVLIGINNYIILDENGIVKKKHLDSSYVI